MTMHGDMCVKSFWCFLTQLQQKFAIENHVKYKSGQVICARPFNLKPP